MMAAAKDNGRPRRRQMPAFLLATAAAGFILLLLQPSLLNDSSDMEVQNQGLRRQLDSEGGSQVIDPNAVILTSDAPPSQRNLRDYCQIVYILGVEGATHHGFIPIIEALAKNQVDPDSNLQYKVTSKPKALKAGLLGWYGNLINRWGFSGRTPAIDDPAFVQQVIKHSCPNDGKKRVLVEWASFPSGQEDDFRSYRVHRQHDWLSMTPEDIANSEKAQQQPFNITAFVEAYSPYADIKFVVLHRPFLETIASHHRWDGGAETHSNIIRAFMLILGRFLDKYRVDLVTGAPLWTLVCVEKIMAKNYKSAVDVIAARQSFVSHLAEFLGWPNKECPNCFDTWYESRKNPRLVLGEKKVEILQEHTKILEGVWPPVEEGASEEQCGI